MQNRERNFPSSDKRPFTSPKMILTMDPAIKTQTENITAANSENKIHKFHQPCMDLERMMVIYNLPDNSCENCIPKNKSSGKKERSHCMSFIKLSDRIPALIPPKMLQ